METGLKAGPLDVIYKFRHRGVKAVICRYMDTYCYFFAFKGEVYIDFILPPNRKELRAHKTDLQSIEPKLISHLCSKAIENIEYHQKERSWYHKTIKQLKQFNVKQTATRWFVKLKSGFSNPKGDHGNLDVPGGRPEGSGDEHVSPAGEAPEAGGVRTRP